MKMQKVSFGDLNIVLNNKNQDGKYDQGVAVSQQNTYSYIIDNKMELKKVADESDIRNPKHYTIYHSDNKEGFNFKAYPKTEENVMIALRNAGINVTKIEKNSEKEDKMIECYGYDADEVCADDTYIIGGDNDLNDEELASYLAADLNDADIYV